MTKHEKELIEKMLLYLIDVTEESNSCARTSYCSVGADEPVHYALTDARLSLKAARDSVLRANAIVAVLLHIRDKEKD
jgi:hypothetical protein